MGDARTCGQRPVPALVSPSGGRTTNNQTLPVLRQRLVGGRRPLGILSAPRRHADALESSDSPVQFINELLGLTHLPSEHSPRGDDCHFISL